MVYYVGNYNKVDIDSWSCLFNLALTHNKYNSLMFSDLMGIQLIPDKKRTRPDICGYRCINILWLKS